MALPPGQYHIEARSDWLRFRWRQLSYAFTPDPPLASLRWDGEEVMGPFPKVKELKSGGQHRLEVECHR